MTAADYSTSTDAFAEMSEGGYSSSDYPQMATYVTNASRLVDQHFGRWPGFFYPSTVDETRYFDGSGQEELTIGEWASITSVSLSEQGGISSSDYTALTENTDFITWPYNRGANNEKPIRKLICFNQGSPLYSVWLPYRKAIKIVGMPGYSATPPGIVVQAVNMQAVRWFMAAKQGYSQQGADATAGQLVFPNPTRLDNAVMSILHPLVMEFLV